jgi:predicted acetyltransferase
MGSRMGNVRERGPGMEQGLEIRTVGEDDFDAFVDAVHTAFGWVRETPVDGGGLWWSALEPERCLAATTGAGLIVGTTGAYPFELTLPGGRLIPAAGVTSVGVLPSHRRRGVFTALMRRQLADLRAEGVPVAVLLASQATIYGRLGYGPATFTQRLTVPHHRGALAPARAGQEARRDDGTVEVLRAARCRDVLEEVYDRYRRAQPGALSRPHRWWERRAGQVPTAPAQRYVALRRDADGTPDGYAVYRVDDSRTLRVDETVAVTGAAYAALVRYALEHDLVQQVEFRHVAPDGTLRWLLADHRAAEVGGHSEWLWVRLLDAPRALAARGWWTDGEIVLDVTDPFLAERHRWLLTVREGAAACAPTDRAPDLSLDIRDLGSVYLGGVTPGTLVRAGHVRAHHEDAAALADLLFRTDQPPHCLHWF